MIYTLENGFQVRATPKGEGMEFETKNAERETVSTVTLYGQKAAEAMTALRVVNGLARKGYGSRETRA